MESIESLFWAGHWWWNLWTLDVEVPHPWLHMLHFNGKQKQHSGPSDPGKDQETKAQQSQSTPYSKYLQVSGNPSVFSNQTHASEKKGSFAWPVVAAREEACASWLAGCQHVRMLHATLGISLNVSFAFPRFQTHSGWNQTQKMMSAHSSPPPFRSKQGSAQVDLHARFWKPEVSQTQHGQHFDPLKSWKRNVIKCQPNFK